MPSLRHYQTQAEKKKEKKRKKLQHVAWTGRTTTWISRHEVPQKRHCKKQRAQRAHSVHTQRLLTFKIVGAQRYDHNRHTSMYQSWCVQREKKGLFKHKFSYFKLLWLFFFLFNHDSNNNKLILNLRVSCRRVHNKPTKDWLWNEQSRCTTTM